MKNLQTGKTTPNEVSASMVLEGLGTTGNRTRNQQACEDDFVFDCSDLVLFRIDEITFEEDAPRQEAMENILAAMRVPGVNFVYLIEGNANGVNIYVGVARDTAAPGVVSTGVKDIGQGILEPSILGNYRGSKITKLLPSDLKQLMARLGNRNHSAIIEGLPGLTQGRDKKSFQGVDRLVDVMLGDTFVLMVLAKPITRDEDQQAIYRDLCRLYALLAPIARQNRQEGKSEEDSETEGSSQSNSTVTENRKVESKGESRTDATVVTDTDSHNDTKRKGKNNISDVVKSINKRIFHSESTGGERISENTNEEGNEGSSSHAQETNGEDSVDTKGRSTNTSTNTEKNESSSTTKSTTKCDNKTTNSSTSHTVHTHHGATAEHVNKDAQEWMKYLDEVVFPRFDYGKGKGLFVVSTCIMADNPKVLLKLGNTVCSLFAGTSGNRVPLKMREVDSSVKNTALERFRKFQVSFANETTVAEAQRLVNAARSHCSLPVKLASNRTEQRLSSGCWMSSAELATVAGIPQKEIVGMKLREEVEFGLNVESDKKARDGELITIGKLIQSGFERNIPVTFRKSDMDRHIFVAGVTGGGKTITCKKLLLDSGMPFLVVEPAKTEYRSLKNSLCPDLLVFTLGSENVAPFRLNPFEFLPGENISSRVDMIKATIEASFDMEAAIPQIIEKAIYACYEDKGWDINTNENNFYEDPFADGVFAFPTFSELVAKCSKVVASMEFGERLGKEYDGSIKARLNGLLVGAKGRMLNCRRSLDFNQLLDRKVVLELEEIHSVSEKSLVMGFILTNLLEAIKQRFKKNGDQKHFHITLLEEAHRLLSRCEPGDSPNKKHGVETFADMLAEIRKYGESLIIADQIPNKMTPEVLKNTNTKIVHRLFAQDDKEVIGSTMALTKEQCNFLSNLEIGRAIMFTGNWDKAVQVKVDMVKESEGHVDERLLRQEVLQLYAENHRRGIIDYSECYKEHRPSIEEMEELLKINTLCWKEFKLLLENGRVTANDIRHLSDVRQNGFAEALFPVILRQHFKDRDVDLHEKMQLLSEMIDGVNGQGMDSLLRTRFNNCTK